MKKKIYLIPETTMVSVELQHLMNISGGDSTNNVVVNGTSDDSNEDNRSRRHFNVWGDEEE